MAAKDFVYVVRFLGSSSQLVTAGKLNVTLWLLNDSLKLQPHPITTGKLQRSVTTAVVTPQFAYLGTTSGDVLEVRSRLASRLTGPDSATFSEAGAQRTRC